MNRKNFFLAMGSVVLFVVGTLAGKANHKYNLRGMYFTVPGGSTVCQEIVGCSPNPAFFSTTSGGAQATITSAGVRARVNLYATSLCKDALYFIP
jgi:hypothetical protein